MFELRSLTNCLGGVDGFLSIPKFSVRVGRKNPRQLVRRLASRSQVVHMAEMNQRGMHAKPFQQGVLMPEEHYVKAFQDWVRDAVGK